MSSPPEQNIPTKALVVEKPGAPFVLQDIILDEVQPNEVLVDMKYAGVCHNDLVVQQGGMPMGSYPAILGHEGAGIILRSGSESAKLGYEPGDRVLLTFSSCRKCLNCTEGRKGACNNIAILNFVGTRGDAPSCARLLDGTPIRAGFFGQSSFSKLAICDSRSLVKYAGPAEDLSFLAPLSCGYLTGAATVLNVLKPRPTSSIAILGLGAVGFSALMAAKAEGVKTIVAVDIIDWRLDLAKSLGATHTILGNDGRNLSIDQAVHEKFPNGVDYIVDTTGLVKMLNGAVKALAHSGTLAIVGTPQHENLSIDGLDMLVHCKNIMGVTGGYSDPQEFIPRLVKMYQDGLFPIKELSKTYPAEKFDEAIQDMKSGKVIKPVIAW